MKIGVDLDDVVFDFVKEVLKSLNKIHGRIVCFKDLNSYMLHKELNISAEELFEILKTLDFVNLPLTKGVKNFILKLSKNNEIFFITSRVFETGTRESLNKNFPNLKYKLFFSSNFHAGTKGKTKGDIAKDLGIDFMIEDCYDYSLMCAKEGIKVFLLNKPWNHTEKQTSKIIRVKNFDEILNKIQEFKNENSNIF